MRSQAANSALASGDLHYVAGVGPNSVAATLRGLPSKAVWFASESLIYTVLARPEFKSLKELHGKRIGLTGLGGTSDVALRIALEAVGENPKNFVAHRAGRAATSERLGKRQHRSGATQFTVELSRQERRLSPALGNRRLCADAFGRAHGVQRGDSKPHQRTQARDPLAADAKKTLLQSKEKAIDLIMRTIKVDREVADEMFADNRRSAAGNGVPSRAGMEQIDQIPTDARPIHRQENSHGGSRRHEGGARGGQGARL